MRRHGLNTGGRPPLRRGPGGFTLAEVLVAILIFAVVSAIAMTLYTQLQKSFQHGENAATQQQNTRIAFDRMVADLRMAGFNYNPDGDLSRPDEQIEGMWPNAVTIRGDFDRDTSDATTPESTLGGPALTFDVVSVGNDEIVTYALGKAAGGGTSLQYQADVSAPRDGTVETVTINNVFTDTNSPPYTLYRIGLTSGASPVPDMQPIADNIRSLVFTYYDGAGNVLGTMAGGMDTASAAAIRKSIAKINVSVVGMTEDPDLAYFDPADTNPDSRNFRKFELTSDVTPRNLGFVGVPDLDLDLPSTPTGLSTCVGHCRGLWVKWNANPPSEGVIKYEVTYGSSQFNQASPQDVYGTSVYLTDANMSPTGTYVVGVDAVDATGNSSDPAAFSAPATLTNALTTPNAPTGLAGTSIGGGNALANQIDVTWTKPTTNMADLTCDDPPYPVRDLKGFRLYRGASAGFDPNIPSQVQASWDPNTLTATDPDPNAADTGVVNCRTYYYRAVAEDLCGVKSLTDATGSGSATSSIPPGTPAGLTATDMGSKQTLLTWTPVTQDTSSPPAGIVIDSYKVWRANVTTGTDPNTATYALMFDGPVASVSSPSYMDPNVPNIPAGESYYYRISARDDCPNESALSAAALVTRCNFGGTVQISMSPGGNPVAGIQTVTVTATGGVVPTAGTLIVRDTVTGGVVLNQTGSSYPYTYTWQANQSPTLPGRSYDVVASITNDRGCTETATTTVMVSVTTACCIAAANPRITNNTTLGSVGGGVKNNEVGFDIVNGCGADVSIERLAMDWTDLLGNAPQLTAWRYEGTPDVVLSPPVNPASGSNPVARFDLRVSPFITYALPTTATTTDPIEVAYVFTKAMVGKIAGNPLGNTILTQYDFVVTGQSGSGRCLVTVIADPNTPGITLCDPGVDPNCPGF